MLEYMIEDLPEYRSRGERIMSVLNGSGSVDVLPGRPDVQASDSDFRKGESYDPPLDFDPNSFSRIDKFDGWRVDRVLLMIFLRGSVRLRMLSRRKKIDRV